MRGPASLLLSPMLWSSLSVSLPPFLSLVSFIPLSCSLSMSLRLSLLCPSLRFSSLMYTPMSSSFLTAVTLIGQVTKEELEAELDNPCPPSSVGPSGKLSLFTSAFSSTSSATLGWGVIPTEPCTPVANGEEGLITSWAGAATAGGIVATETMPVGRATVGAG